MKCLILWSAPFLALAASSARSQVSIVSSFRASTIFQSGMAVHRGANRGYLVSTFGNDSIDIVDLDTNRVVQTVGTVGSRFVLSPDEKLLAVGDEVNNGVVVYRTDAGMARTTVPLVGTSGFNLVQTVFADDRTMFAFAQKNDPSLLTRMWPIDCATLAPSPFVDLPDVLLGRIVPFPTRRSALAVGPPEIRIFDFDSPRAMRSVTLAAPTIDVHFRNDGASVWITTRADTIDLVDLVAGTVVRSWPTGPMPGRFAIDDRRGTLVVECDGDDTLQVIDAATGAILTTVPTPGVALTWESTPLPVVPEVGLALLPAFETDSVHVVDVAPESPTFGTVLRTIALPGCTGSCEPRDVVVSPDGRFGYVISANRFQVDVLGLPLPPVSVTLVPSGYRVSPGGSLSFDIVVRNSTGTPRPTNAWIDVLRPNGVPLAANPVLGPFTATLPPNRVARRTLGLPIRSSLRPSGPFTLRASVGTFPSSVLDVSEIRFVVGS